MAIIGKPEGGLIASDIGLPPWFYSRAVALSRAVGRVSVGGRGFGTGFLVAPRLMLTCHSVLPDAATASGSAFELDYHSNEDGTFEPVTAVHLRPDLCFVADAPRDFALVALETPLTDRPVIALAAEGGKRSVFISYARGDQGKRQWRDRLRTFLAPFQTEIDVWDDSRIETGAQWRAEIDFALKRARVAVLLVGPAFLASDFIASNELPPLLQAARTEGVIILPLITNHSSYEKTPLGGYQAFNDIKHPLEDMGRSEQNKWLRLFAEKISDAFHKAGT